MGWFTEAACKSQLWSSLAVCQHSRLTHRLSWDPFRRMVLHQAIDPSTTTLAPPLYTDNGGIPANKTSMTVSRYNTVGRICFGVHHHHYCPYNWESALSLIFGNTNDVGDLLCTCTSPLRTEDSSYLYSSIIFHRLVVCISGALSVLSDPLHYDNIFEGDGGNIDYFLDAKRGRLRHRTALMEY